MTVDTGDRGSPTPTCPLTAPTARPIAALVVDDEAVLAEMVSMALRYEGWSVTTAGDGAAALAAARAQRPRRRRPDVMLPDMSGLDVYSKLRALHRRCRCSC